MAKSELESHSTQLESNCAKKPLGVLLGT